MMEMLMEDMLRALKEADIPVAKVYRSPDPDIEDDHIELGAGYGVQVGENYYVLTRSSGEGDDLSIRHYAETDNPNRIITDFRIEELHRLAPGWRSNDTGS
tara:strand:- start:993 stop:1295 length:303 start_codon:yes stop_codon:yes gene_type:complete